MTLFDPIFDLDRFFFSFPTKSEDRPPTSQMVIKEKDGTVLGVRLQIAVAGFDEKDVKVWHENNVLHIEGTSLGKEDINDRFQIDFKKVFPVTEQLDLKESLATVSKGLLTVFIPVRKKEENRTYLLGTCCSKKCLTE